MTDNGPYRLVLTDIRRSGWTTDRLGPIPVGFHIPVKPLLITAAGAVAGTLLLGVVLVPLMAIPGLILAAATGAALAALGWVWKPDGNRYGWEHAQDRVNGAGGLKNRSKNVSGKRVDFRVIPISEPIPRYANEEFEIPGAVVCSVPPRSDNVFRARLRSGDTEIGSSWGEVHVVGDIIHGNR